MSLITSPSVIANTAGPQLITGWREYRLDKKCRLVIPREWLALLGLPFVMVPTRDGRLFVTSNKRWRRLLQSGGSHPLYDHANLTGTEQICTLDWTTSRILIPYPLREHVGLRPGMLVRMVGRGDAVEIISRDRWLKEQAP